MKTLILVSAIALAACTAAFAQSGESQADVPDADVVHTTGSINPVTMEQQRAIRGYWHSRRHVSTVLPNGTVVSRGAVMPETVTLHAFPAEVGMAQYRYFVVGENLYLVNRTDRRIVQVIE